MPRLRNTVNGAVVSVSDEKAARLGTHWVPFDQPQEPEPKPTTRRSKK